MDKALLKKAAMQSVALMIAVITLSYAMKHYQTITIEASSLSNDEKISTQTSVMTEEEADTGSGQSDQNTLQQVSYVNSVDTPITNVDNLKNRIDSSILKQLSDKFLVIRKPEGQNLVMSLEDLYINHSIQLNITGITKNNLKSQMVLRVRDKQLFVGDPVYTENISSEVVDEDGTTQEVVTKDFGADLCHGITFASKEGSDGQYTVQIQIELDNVYAYIIYEDKDNYYINLKKPSEVYDKIVVIDAGHGGKDAGAVTKNEKFYEKNINLGIVLDLKKLLDQENIKVYYTRTADDKVFLRPRVTLANSVDADYFISIHCNANEVASPNGTEVLYYDTVFKGVKSANLASLFSNEIAKTVALKQQGIIKKHMDDIFIMSKSQVPTILIEVGYITNRNDLNYLTSTENQKTIAQGIFNGIMRAYKELPVTK